MSCKNCEFIKQMPHDDFWRGDFVCGHPKEEKQNYFISKRWTESPKWCPLKSEDDK